MMLLSNLSIEGLFHSSVELRLGSPFFPLWRAAEVASVALELKT